MRITGGRWRSRVLRSPRGDAVRPTPDALRERAFAVLGDRVAGARVLDLYAGSGAVGLEALSRGAATVVFVEAHRAGQRLVRDNCAALGAESARVVAAPVERALPRLAREGLVFDLVWADPPFPIWPEGLAAVERAAGLGLLAPDALCCLECPARAEVASRVLTIERDLAGGASRLVLLRTAAPTSAPP